MPKRQLTGIIVSNKMQKTVVVRVESIKVHAKYKKIFRVHKKYKAHTEEMIPMGSKVTIEECRPISKDKKWKVVKVVTENKEQQEEETENL